jgi:transcriptional regulator with XRE-family HTH domain
MDALPFRRLALNAAKPKNPAYPASLTTLGDRIRARRLDLGLLQKDVAAQIICTVNSITNWELNRSRPEIQYIPRIIAFLGYDPNGDWTSGSLGERLRLQRERLGLSREKTARLLRTDESNLASWETGRHRPTRKSLVLIEGFLSWTPELAVSRIDAPPTAAGEPDLFS